MRPQDPFSSPCAESAGDPPADEAVRVAAARGGDRAAQEALLRAHYRGIHALAFRLVGNPEDAEDLAQECFVRAFRSLELYRGAGSFAGWLRRIVVHLAQDRYRSQGQRARSVSLPEELAGGREPHRVLESRELRVRLADALESLGAPLRVALLLRTREGLEYEAIAELTGVTAETVRTRVMKARKVLLRLLAPYLRGNVEERSERSSERR
jgi:RNA polymerase sigma-70 factor (ECF subfamily)